MNIRDWFGEHSDSSEQRSDKSQKRSGKTGTTAYCSFCRKSNHVAGPLVEGPGDSFICGECVKLCGSILDQEKRRRGSRVCKLHELAHGRSGDKGNHANIGIACRSEATYPHLASALTAERVEQYFRELGPSRVVRYELPNLWAFNFVLYDVLDGGASRSLRTDSQGKTLALQLLELEISVPEKS